MCWTAAWSNPACEREGYFCVDRDSVDGRLVFNRTVGLRESWPREA